MNSEVYFDSVNLAGSKLSSPSETAYRISDSTWIRLGWRFRLSADVPFAKAAGTNYNHARSEPSLKNRTRGRCCPEDPSY